MTDTFDRVAKRSLRRMGRSVTLVNQSAKTDANGDPKRDSYNDVKWQSKDTTDTTAEVVYRGQQSFDRRADGIHEDIDALAWVSADDSADVTDGDDDEATRATRIKVDNERYIVRQTFDEDNGLIRCHCRMEDD